MLSNSYLIVTFLRHIVENKTTNTAWVNLRSGRFSAYDVLCRFIHRYGRIYSTLKNIVGLLLKRGLACIQYTGALWPLDRTQDTKMNMFNGINIPGVLLMYYITVTFGTSSHKVQFLP